MSALDAARVDLTQRAQQTADWQERRILTPLAEVADMVCRVGNNPSSAHYRAEKAGRLVTAAASVQQATLIAYSEALPAGLATADELDRVAGILANVTAEVTAAMWAVARNDRLTTSAARELRRTVASLARWADEVTEAAVPDPTD